MLSPIDAYHTISLSFPPLYPVITPDLRAGVRLSNSDMKKYILSVACMLLMKPLVVFSQLDQIIVTATRTAQTVDDTLASVTIITRDDIEEQQASSVQDLLRVVQGIDIVNNGGAGKSTSVHIRGTNSGHVLVLIDGVKVGSATLGTTAFEHIPTEQIDRVEIVRGPRSSLYGSEAIGGVVQIFTRRGGGETTPHFSLGIGSFQTVNQSAGVSGSSGDSWYNVNASMSKSEGFDASTNLEPDKDGYENQSLALRAGHRFENELELEAQALRSDSVTEFDGSSENSSESVQQIISTTLRYSPTDIWHFNLAIGNSVDESDSFLDGTFASRFKTDRDTVSWQNDFRLSPRQLLTAGIDYQQDEVDSDSTYAVTSRDNTGVFTEYQATVSGHDLQLSARQDDNDQFGSFNTGGISWGHHLGDNLRLTASWGTAFKAPTFNDLYFPNANPALEPEQSESYELGVSSENKQISWSLNIYETNIEDLILWMSTDISDPLAAWSPSNIGEVRLQGIEANLSALVQEWKINTNLTLLNAKDRSGGSTHNNLLPRRAEESVSFSAVRKFGQISLGTTLKAVGKRYDDLANTIELDSYTTVDLRIDYLMAKNWAIQAKAENLTDEDYQTAYGYNQPERSFYLTLRYQP